MLHIHRVISRCLSKATQMRMIPRNPAVDVDAPKPNANKTGDLESGDKTEAIENEDDIDAFENDHNAIDRERLDTLLRGFQGRALFPIVATAAGTGMRRSEILALRWSDINFETKTVRITRSVEDTKEGGIRFKRPKNKKSNRSIGIDAGLVRLLRSHRARQGEDALKLGIRPSADALVFPRSPIEPTMPRRPRGVTKEFRKAADKLGFVGFRFHDLRHTHATLLLEAGVPINSVSHRLGHASAMITLTVYAHALPNSKAQAAVVAGSLLEGALGIA